MIAEIQYMEKGKVYRVRNRKNNLYLTSGDEVTLTELGKNKISQLWLFDEIKPMIYEIVSLQFGVVLSRREKITIQKGDWSAGQFWKLQRAQITKNANYFWVISHEDENKYLCGSAMDSKIKMKSFDATLFVTNWGIQEVDLNQDLSGCCIFRSTYSDLVIDVPEGSNKDGVPIIQYSCNGRGNQRWVLENMVGSFVIRNLCSNMILSPQGKNVKAGVKIVQTQFSNVPEHKWNVVEKSPEEFVIANVKDPTFCIGVNSKRESSGLILTTEKDKCVWALTGSIPQLKHE